MVIISIGELWDRPIPISEDKLLPLSVYSDIDITESERTTLESYSTEAYQQSHEIYDIASECVYFTNLFPEECCHSETNEQCTTIRWLGSVCENNLRECHDNDGGHSFQNEKPKTLSAKCSDQGVITQVIPPHSDGEKNDLRVDNYKICDGSGQIICPHASKALRVRSSAAKDRHCKVKTAKGLRDRRVRLSVSTALKVYELQDRLGIDNPSKAIDWLISKAKAAIDKLPEPSYISNLNCPLCSSISSDVSIAPLVNFALGANINSQSDINFVERKDSTQENGREPYSGNYIRIANRGGFKKENKAKIKVPTTIPSITLQCESATRKPLIHATSSKEDDANCYYPGRGRREVSIANSSGNHQYPSVYAPPVQLQPQPQLPYFGQQPGKEHQKITTKSHVPEVFVHSKAVDLTYGNTKSLRSSQNSIRTWEPSFDSMPVEPSQSFCSLVNLLNSPKMPIIASLLTDMSGCSSSASSKLECARPQSPPMIQPWWFGPEN